MTGSSGGRASAVLRRGVCIAGIAASGTFLLLWALFFVRSSRGAQIMLVCVCYLFSAAAVVLLARRFAPKSGIMYATLFALSFLYQFLFSFCIKITPTGDLQFYYETARTLAQDGFSLPSMYNATFPGTVTYPAFLAVFMRLFGVSAAVPVMLNQLVMCAAVCAIFAFLRRLMSDWRALAGSLIAALHPYVIIYSATCNAELIFGAFVLFAYFAFDRAASAGKARYYALGAAAGALCGIADFFRPIAVIMVIALSLDALVFGRERPKRRIIFTALLVAAYIPFGFLQRAVVKAVTSYDAPSAGYGWNLYVGASEKGLWNEEDGAEFGRVFGGADSPDQVQTYFAQKAWERYSGMGLGIIPHALVKTAYWQANGYIAETAATQSSGTRFSSADQKGVFFAVITAFEAPVTALALGYCLWLAVSAFRGRKRRLLPLVFYLLGSAAALMLLEAAPRYTVSHRIVFCVLAAAALNELWSRRREIKSLFVRDKYPAARPDEAGKVPALSIK